MTLIEQHSLMENYFVRVSLTMSLGIQLSIISYFQVRPWLQAWGSGLTSMASHHGLTSYSWSPRQVKPVLRSPALCPLTGTGMAGWGQLTHQFLCMQNKKGLGNSSTFDPRLPCCSLWFVMAKISFL